MAKPAAKPASKPAASAVRGGGRAERAHDAGRQAPRQLRSQLNTSTASTVGRGVVHHPSHQLIERDASIRGKLGHERCLGHARLCIDLKTDQLTRSPIVIAKVCAAYAAAAERVMGGQGKSAYFLVNIW